MASDKLQQSFLRLDVLQSRMGELGLPRKDCTPGSCTAECEAAIRREREQYQGKWATLVSEREACEVNHIQRLRSLRLSRKTYELARQATSLKLDLRSHFYRWLGYHQSCGTRSRATQVNKPQSHKSSALTRQLELQRVTYRHCCRLISRALSMLRAHAKWSRCVPPPARPPPSPAPRPSSASGACAGKCSASPRGLRPWRLWRRASNGLQPCTVAIVRCGCLRRRAERRASSCMPSSVLGVPLPLLEIAPPPLFA
jgi:hypothetical protein